MYISYAKIAVRSSRGEKNDDDKTRRRCRFEKTREFGRILELPRGAKNWFSSFLVVVVFLVAARHLISRRWLARHTSYRPFRFDRARPHPDGLPARRVVPPPPHPLPSAGAKLPKDRERFRERGTFGARRPGSVTHEPRRLARCFRRTKTEPRGAALVTGPSPPSPLPLARCIPHAKVDKNKSVATKAGLVERRTQRRPRSRALRASRVSMGTVTPRAT